MDTRMKFTIECTDIGKSSYEELRMIYDDTRQVPVRRQCQMGWKSSDIGTHPCMDAGTVTYLYLLEDCIERTHTCSNRHCIVTIAMKLGKSMRKRIEWYRDVPRSPSRGVTSRVYKEPNFGIWKDNRCGCSMRLVFNLNEEFLVKQRHQECAPALKPIIGFNVVSTSTLSPHHPVWSPHRKKTWRLFPPE